MICRDFRNVFYHVYCNFGILFFDTPNFSTKGILARQQCVAVLYSYLKIIVKLQVLGLGLRVDFTFAWDNNNNDNKNDKNPNLNFWKGKTLGDKG